MFMFSQVTRAQEHFWCNLNLIIGNFLEFTSTCGYAMAIFLNLKFKVKLEYIHMPINFSLVLV